jgi:tripartite-type tricarboxylate transporter receptor subunit TctC
MVPAKTPASIVQKINLEVQRILKLPDTRERLATMGADPLFMSAQEANRFFHAEIEKWAKVVRASGAKAD